MESFQGMGVFDLCKGGWRNGEPRSRAGLALPAAALSCLRGAGEVKTAGNKKAGLWPAFRGWRWLTSGKPQPPW